MPSTGGGWPSFYAEEHHSQRLCRMEAMLTSMVFEGVFEALPDAAAGGRSRAASAWLPPLAWRLDELLAALRRPRLPQ